jgi:hypothetical protein
VAGSVLTDQTLADLAAGAGWVGGDRVTAVAVALAESQGDATVRGDTTLQTGKWGPSVGLWQIRSLNAQKGTGGQRDELANLNPATNAQHAHEIWAAQGWGPWSTYTTGRYLLYLPRARQVAGGAAAGRVASIKWGDILDKIPGIGTGKKGVPGQDPVGDGGVGGAILGPLEPAVAAVVRLAELAGKTGAWAANPAHWGRVALVLVGGTLVVVGVSGLIAGPALEAAGTVGKVRAYPRRIARAAGG